MGTDKNEYTDKFCQEQTKWAVSSDGNQSAGTNNEETIYKKN